MILPPAPASIASPRRLLFYAIYASGVVFVAPQLSCHFCRLVEQTQTMVISYFLYP